MPRLFTPADTLNPYVEIVEINTGYELCARCGHVIGNGDSAFVMWRSQRYGAFAHTYKCSSKKPRNWTKILKYEQANETLTWNSLPVPAYVTALNTQAALSTKEPETRSYQWGKVTWAPGKLRNNRFEWIWTAGDPNWKRIDRWNEKGECVQEGKIEMDSQVSSVVIAGHEFPFVSLLDWNHIRNAVDIVDIELAYEFPAKFSGLGDTHDGIPNSDKVRVRTVVEKGRGNDDELGTEGMRAVVKRIVCTNREEQKMLDRLNLRPHHYIVETMKRMLPSYRTENARTGGAPLYSAPTPELVRVSFPVPKIDREKSVEDILRVLIIREERKRSYGTGRKVVLSPDFLYWNGSDQRGHFPKDLTSKMGCFHKPKPKVTGNGPGEGQSWDVFGEIVDRALYSDWTPRIFENRCWRRLEHPEYVEWQTRPVRQTLPAILSHKDIPEQWLRLMFPKEDAELTALVNFWAAFGNSGLGESPSAYDRPWQYLRREIECFVSQNTRGEGQPDSLAVEMASPPCLLGEGAGYGSLVYY